MLYFLTLRRLLARHAHEHKRQATFLIAFSTALLLLITVYMSTEAVFGQEMWIVNAGFPGGANAWFAANVSVWYQTMGTASFVVLQLLADGLLIYRAFVLYNDARVAIVTAFVWIATLGLGVVELWASGVPSGDVFAGKAVNLGLAYFSTTIGLNVLLTVLICSRILYHARKARRLSSHDMDRAYTGAAAIIIESALPYTLSGIAYLVSDGLNSGISIVMGALYAMFACISPQLLIYRLTSDVAWTRQTHLGIERTAVEDISEKGSVMVAV
ncbi:hypothetical protein CERSUDRAFT_162569 [Gelatoporia subvermispora B]|uniref:Uncharacterized protein n=1 Tax=Ceriporiopsis subvermispora (strain B) TaxID=914234 RepID=M2QZ39_CERS8|nr:hypothetical protein CERSUDRAFT_162569 [Gelatoporia subvermispora B]